MQAPPVRQVQRGRRKETRERLLAAARRVFASHGYHAATLDEIAADAGFTKGALYYNFASKEELFLALLDEHVESRIALLRDLRGGPTRARLAEGAERTMTSLAQQREWSLLYLEFAAYAARNPGFRRQFERRLGLVHEAMVQTIQALSSDRRELGLPADTLARGISALVDGIAFGRLLQPRALPDDLLGQMIALIWAGAQSSKS